MEPNVNPRIFSATYSLPLIVKAGTPLNNSTKIYFDPAPYLLNVNVAALSIQFTSLGLVLLGASYLTLVNSKKEPVLNNYPVSDLWNNDNQVNPPQSGPFRLRLTKIDGILTQNSYITNSIVTPGQVGTELLATLTIYIN
jgi:hypothetical protein